MRSFEDAVFYDPKGGIFRGRAEIDRIAGEIRTIHRDFRYQPIGEPEEAGNGGHVRWVEGRPGEAPALAGTDFIIARDGRIAAIISSSTSYPELDSRASSLPGDRRIVFGGLGLLAITLFLIPPNTSQLSWETRIELPTLMDVEKMVDETGIEPASSSLRTVGKIS